MDIEKMKKKKDVEGLIKALKDKDENVREGAAFALGEIGDKKAIEPLIKALKDEEKQVREEAAHALGKIGVAKYKVLYILKKLVYGFCLFGLAYLSWQYMNYTFEHYIAVGSGLDPRGLISFVAIGFFVAGAINIFFMIKSLLHRSKRK